MQCAHWDQQAYYQTNTYKEVPAGGNVGILAGLAERLHPAARATEFCHFRDRSGE